MMRMTDDQFAAHNRDLLRWVLKNCRMAQRIAAGKFRF